MDTAKRSRYKQKKYPNKPVNPGQEQKKLCPQCLKKGEYNALSKTSKQFRSLEDTNKIERICPILFCLYCDYTERIESEIKKIPK